MHNSRKLGRAGWKKAKVLAEFQSNSIAISLGNLPFIKCQGMTLDAAEIWLSEKHLREVKVMLVYLDWKKIKN